MNSAGTSRVKAVDAIVDVTGTLILVFLFLFPFLWMVSMSFKDRIQTFQIPPLWFFQPTLENYRALFAREIFGTYFVNSVAVIVFSVLVSFVLAAPAAYALSRFDFKGKKDISFWILSVRMAPAIAVVIPYFFLGSFMGILDTRLILIIAYLSFNVPFATWMLKGFMDEIPTEVDEAALIDGSSRFQVFSRLIIPLTANGLAATSILCLIQSWNEFTFALFLTTTEARTLPTIVTQFLTFQGVVWGEMSAAATITVLPAVVFAILVRKHLITGLSFGAVKE
ncbi:MAG: carbohydrate ABC transporter permease [Firmicutes bacterium]|nr:carbohydrate ABC transporter permease [Bacillota bacterium]